MGRTGSPSHNTYRLRGVRKGRSEGSDDTPLPPSYFFFGGGSNFYTFPIQCVREDISAKKT